MQQNLDENIMTWFFLVPGSHKQIYSLYHFHGYTCGDIGRVMNAAPETIEARIHRAHKSLETRLRNTGAYQGITRTGGNS